MHLKHHLKSTKTSPYTFMMVLLATGLPHYGHIQVLLKIPLLGGHQTGHMLKGVSVDHGYLLNLNEKACIEKRTLRKWVFVHIMQNVVVSLHVTAKNGHYGQSFRTLD